MYLLAAYKTGLTNKSDLTCDNITVRMNLSIESAIDQAARHRLVQNTAIPVSIPESH